MVFALHLRVGPDPLFKESKGVCMPGLPAQPFVNAVCMSLTPLCSRGVKQKRLPPDVVLPVT